MEKKVEDKKDEKKVTLVLEIEELEKKIAPRLSANHSETLVRDFQG